MNDLDKKFDKAFEIASSMTNELPPDVMLHFYAFYKIASNEGNIHIPSGNSELRNGFKLNALFQFNHLTVEEAKERYIALVEKHTNKKIT
jgi:acyl-CoA-binding protein